VGDIRGKGLVVWQWRDWQSFLAGTANERSGARPPQDPRISCCSKMLKLKLAQQICTGVGGGLFTTALRRVIWHWV